MCRSRSMCWFSSAFMPLLRFSKLASPFSGCVSPGHCHVRSSTVGMQARKVTQKRHRLTQNDARITRKITREKEPGECRLQARLFPYVGENGAVLAARSEK